MIIVVHSSYCYKCSCSSYGGGEVTAEEGEVGDWEPLSCNGGGEISGGGNNGVAKLSLGAVGCTDLVFFGTGGGAGIGLIAGGC